MKLNTYQKLLYRRLLLHTQKARKLSRHVTFMLKSRNSFLFAVTIFCKNCSYCSLARSPCLPEIRFQLCMIPTIVPNIVWRVSASSEAIFLGSRAAETLTNLDFFVGFSLPSSKIRPMNLLNLGEDWWERFLALLWHLQSVWYLF